MNRMERIAGASRAVWLGLALGMAVLALRYSTLAFRWEADQQVIRESGLLALGFFASALLCTPLRKLLRRLGYPLPEVAPVRRTLGLAATVTAGLHLALVYTLHFKNAPWFSPWLKPYSQAGAAAFVAMSLLAITSFPRTLRSLKIRHWKTLHRLVHVIFFLLFIHVLLGPHVNLLPTLALFSILGSMSWGGRLNP